MHQKWMKHALTEAAKAKEKAEVPIGAIVVLNNEIIGRGHNLVETQQDPTAHAEMIAISSAAYRIASWRLNEANIYVTLEPCPMCMSAIHLARIFSLIYGARDPRFGACGSYMDLSGLNVMRAPIEIVAGVLQDESSQLLRRFFQKIRTTDK